MLERLRKWIHRNDVAWLEEHGYVDKEETVELREEYVPMWIPPEDPKPQLLSVGRRGLGVGYGQFKT